MTADAVQHTKSLSSDYPHPEGLPADALCNMEISVYSDWLEQGLSSVLRNPENLEPSCLVDIQLGASVVEAPVSRRG